MTTISRGKKTAGLTLSLAVLLSASTLGAGIANAAIPTVQDGTPPAYTMTAAEQAQINSYTRYTGELKSLELPQAVIDSWAKIGFSIDIPASIAATNTYNDAHNTNFLIIVANNNIASFVANSPYAANIDPATKTTNGSPSGIGFLTNGGDGSANMTLPQFQTTSPLQTGQISNSALLYPTAGLTTNDPSTFYPDKTLPAGQWIAGFIAPSSSTYDGGVANTTDGTPTSKTWYRDGYASSDARNTDITLGGAQRGHNLATLVDCGTTTACGVSIQPMAYGNIVGSANLETGTMAVGDAGFMTIVSTRHEVMPTAKSEATAMTLASGTKVWFTPQNHAAQGLTDGTGNPNEFNPAVPINPAPAGSANQAFAPILANTTVTQDADGALSIGLETQSAYADAPISESIVPAAAASNYTMTLNSTDPRMNGVWLNSQGTAFAVGDSKYYADGNTTMTVTGNSNGVLTFNVAVGVIITGDPTLKASNTISTSIAGAMATDAFGELTYEAHYILPTDPVDIPETPTTPVDDVPTTPVVPETPAPTGDSDGDPVAPPTGDSSSRPFVNIGNTSANFGAPTETVEAASVTPQGDDNRGLATGGFVAAGLALIGCLVLALRKKVSNGVKAIKVHADK